MFSFNRIDMKEKKKKKTQKTLPAEKWDWLPASTSQVLYLLQVGEGCEQLRA